MSQSTAVPINSDQQDNVHSTDGQTSSTIGQDDLYDLFTAKRECIGDQRNFVCELVSMLGFDRIMNILLKAPTGSDNLTSEDRIKIHQYLSKIGADSETPVNDYDSQIIERNAQLVWTLNPTNNMLFSISPYAAEHLFTRYMLGISAVAAAIWWMLNFVLRKDQRELHIIITIVAAWIWPIPLCILMLMSVNREMIPRIKRSADTWVMTVYGILLGIYNSIYSIIMEDASLGVKIANIITSNLIFLVLMILVVSSLDGFFGWHRWTRSLSLTILAVMLAYNMIWTQFKAEECIVVINGIGEYGNVSITERIGNCSQILFVFMAKQAFVSWIKGSSRCAAVRYSPLIEWKELSTKTAEKEANPHITTGYSAEVVYDNESKDQPIERSINGNGAEKEQENM